MQQSAVRKTVELILPLPTLLLGYDQVLDHPCLSEEAYNLVKVYAILRCSEM